MLLAGTLLASSMPCTPADIAAAAIVSPAKQEGVADADLSNADEGLWGPTVQDILWRGHCTPRVVGLYGGRTLVTATGLLLSIGGESKLEIRDDHRLASDPEPPHPEWPEHRFTGSASLLAGTWRIGTWVRRDGTTDIARYRPEDTRLPILLLTSARPVVGIYYLGLPDAVGGTLFFAQRLGPSHFRMVQMGWSEAGLRSQDR
jgi:hypothetical protein